MMLEQGRAARCVALSLFIGVHTEGHSRNTVRNASGLSEAAGWCRYGASTSVTRSTCRITAFGNGSGHHDFRRRIRGHDERTSRRRHRNRRRQGICGMSLQLRRAMPIRHRDDSRLRRPRHQPRSRNVRLPSDTHRESGPGGPAALSEEGKSGGFGATGSVSIPSSF
jgi:hypothetical protein